MLFVYHQTRQDLQSKNYRRLTHQYIIQMSAQAIVSTNFVPSGSPHKISRQMEGALRLAKCTWRETQGKPTFSSLLAFRQALVNFFLRDVQHLPSRANNTERLSVGHAGVCPHLGHGLLHVQVVGRGRAWLPLQSYRQACSAWQTCCTPDLMSTAQAPTNDSTSWSPRARACAGPSTQGNSISMSIV